MPQKKPHRLDSTSRKRDSQKESSDSRVARGPFPGFNLVSGAGSRMKTFASFVPAVVSLLPTQAAYFIADWILHPHLKT